MPRNPSREMESLSTNLVTSFFLKAGKKEETIFCVKEKVIYFRLCWAFTAVQAFLVARSKGSSLVVASHCGGFSCCGAQALEHV